MRHQSVAILAQAIEFSRVLWHSWQSFAMWMLGGPAQDAAKKAWAEFYFKIKFGVVYCTAISLLPYILRWCGVGQALKDE
mmetsp:Transcript_3564/g.4128  ORF Transcript_3564/g.4128 Transcript_3564/m.4128 type:complete len:80 (+) Transcript_3564:3-242(+)